MCDLRYICIVMSQALVRRVPVPPYFFYDNLHISILHIFLFSPIFITASRIHVSESTYLALRLLGQYIMEKRGNMEIKVKF